MELAIMILCSCILSFSVLFLNTVNINKHNLFIQKFRGILNNFQKYKRILKPKFSESLFLKIMSIKVIKAWVLPLLLKIKDTTNTTHTQSLLNKISGWSTFICVTTLKWNNYKLKYNWHISKWSFTLGKSQSSNKHFWTLGKS